MVSGRSQAGQQDALTAVSMKSLMQARQKACPQPAATPSSNGSWQMLQVPSRCSASLAAAPAPGAVEECTTRYGWSTACAATEIALSFWVSAASGVMDLLAKPIQLLAALQYYEHTWRRRMSRSKMWA